MATTYSIYISDGSEINERGTCAVILAYHDPAEDGWVGDPAAWIGEKVTVGPDDIDQGAVDYRAVFGADLDAAKARAAELAGTELDWAETTGDAGSLIPVGLQATS